MEYTGVGMTLVAMSGEVLLNSILEKLFGLGNADSVSLPSVSSVTCCTENECYAREQ